MEKIHFSTFIKAPKDKVWNTMLNDTTYREWTKVFNPTSDSYFKGGWNTGDDIKFLGDNPDGTTSGMFATIAEARPYEFMSIQHLGEIHNDVLKPWPTDENGNTYQTFENYTFIEKDGGTQLDIDIDVVEEYKDMFNGMWPKALEKLKEISEK